MIYRLVDILEDIDFGCEEREGDLPLMAFRRETASISTRTIR